MKVVILGLGADPEWVEKYSSAIGEVWAINDWWSVYPNYIPDRALQLHLNLPEQPLPKQPWRWNNWVERYRKLGNKVLLSDYDSRFPEAIIANTRELEEVFGASHFTSSCACAIMIARFRFNVDEVILAGFTLQGEEFELQTPGIMRAVTSVEDSGGVVLWEQRKKIRTVDWTKVNDVQLQGYWRK